MRTTLDLKDNLVTALMLRFPDRSKTEAIERAVEGFLAQDAISLLKQRAGTVEIDDLSLELRKVDRTT